LHSFSPTLAAALASDDAADSKTMMSGNAGLRNRVSAGAAPGIPSRGTREQFSKQKF
jgi:hypothetical protein